MWDGTVPLLPVTVGSEAWVPNRAVESGGMGCRGAVVDGGGVVGASGVGGNTYKNIQNKIHMGAVR